MKLSNYAIPYPILGIKGAFNDNVLLKNDLRFESKKDNYVFTVELKTDDPQIHELIKQGKAQYSCEVDCTSTYYRKAFLSPTPIFDITIPKVSLVGRVPFFFSIVVTEDIDKYKNDNFNQKFYAGYSFNLSKGHMLAYFGQRIFDADIKYNELKALDSIMEVKPDEKANYTYFDFSDAKIRIFLPKTDYDNFVRSNNHTYSDITHASIVQCALVSAISSYKGYASTVWARTLNIRVQNEPNLKKFTDLGSLNNKEIMEMVSIILKNPNQRMFNKLNSLAND